MSSKISYQDTQGLVVGMNFIVSPYSLVNGRHNNQTDSGGSGHLAAPERGWDSCWKCSLKGLYL